MIIILILLAAVAFLSGFLYGSMKKPRKGRSVTEKNGFEIKPITEKVYENFLKYDGSEQF